MGKKQSKLADSLLDDLERNVVRRQPLLPHLRPKVPVAEREKKRFDEGGRVEYTPLNLEQLDHSVDRYDYVLVMRDPQNLDEFLANKQSLFGSFCPCCCGKDTTDDGTEGSESSASKNRGVSGTQSLLGRETDDNELENGQGKKKKEAAAADPAGRWGDKKTVTWGQAAGGGQGQPVGMWYQATPGMQEDKEKACSKMAGYWRAMQEQLDQTVQEVKAKGQSLAEQEDAVFSAGQTRRRPQAEAIRAVPLSEMESDEELPLSGWLELLWNKLTNDLSKLGLHMKQTVYKPDKHTVFRVALLRAPPALIAAVAEREGYRLPFREEVDPGKEFWLDEEEILNEKGLLDKKKTVQRLQALYDKYNIPPDQVNIFEEDEPSARFWTRRLRVLERVVDQVQVDPQAGSFPAYAPFTRAPAKQHLWRPHPTLRGHTFFLAKDRLRLVADQCSQAVFMDVLAAQLAEVAADLRLGLPEDAPLMEFMPLHDASRGDIVTRESLRKNWVTIYRAHAKGVGAPLGTDPEQQFGVNARPFTRLWCQPLDDIRSYYGEKLALYFAWLGAYCWFLRPWALLGLAVQAYLYFYGTGAAEEGFQYWTAAVCVLVVLQTSAMHVGWKAEEEALAVKWGTEGFEEQEKDRPAFKADENEPTRINRITNEMELNYPEEKRQLHSAIHYLIIAGCVAGVVVLVHVLYATAGYMEYSLGFTWASDAASLALAIMIVVLSDIYEGIVEAMVEKENHRTDTEFEDALISKTFAFQLVNNYAALGYTAFYKQYSAYGCSADSCLSDLTTLMMFILAMTVVMNLVELEIHLALWNCLKSCLCCCCRGKGDGDGGGEGEGEEEEEQEEGEWQKELALKPEEGTFGDYAEIVVQYGLITLFAAALPGIQFAAMVLVLIEIRSDAFKFTALTRRPVPVPAEDVGAWGTLTCAMGFLAVPFNVGIVVFTTENFAAYSVVNRWLLFLVATQALLCLKVCLHFAGGDAPEWVETLRARQRFVVDKYLNVKDSDEDGGGGGKPGGKLGPIDINDLGFQEDYLELNKELKLKVNRPKKAYIQEKTRRLDSQLRQAKGQLLRIAKYIAQTDEEERAPGRPGLEDPAASAGEEYEGVARSPAGVPLGYVVLKLARVRREVPEGVLLGPQDRDALPRAVDLEGVARLEYDEPHRHPPLPEVRVDKAFFPSYDDPKWVFDSFFHCDFAPVASRRATLVFELWARPPGGPRELLGTVRFRLDPDSGGGGGRPAAGTARGSVQSGAAWTVQSGGTAAPAPALRLDQRMREFDVRLAPPPAAAAGDGGRGSERSGTGASSGARRVGDLGSAARRVGYALELAGSFSFSKAAPLEPERRRLVEEIKRIEQELTRFYLGMLTLEEQKEVEEEVKADEEEGAEEEKGHQGNNEAEAP